MKKQSGFTLIELMVVMAIIAILATAGLSAYTGFLKKARDTVRAQIARQIGIKVTELSANGVPTPAQLEAALNAENFGYTLPTMHPIVANVSSLVDTILGTTFAQLRDLDPLSGRAACIDGTGSPGAVCGILYAVTKNGAAWVLGYSLEDEKNRGNFWQVDAPEVSPGAGSGVGNFYGNFFGSDSDITQSNIVNPNVANIITDYTTITSASMMSETSDYLSGS